MKYLIDTCVISELIKKNPDKKVVSFINKQKEKDIYLSILTIGEIYIKDIKSMGCKYLDPWN